MISPSLCLVHQAKCEKKYNGKTGLAKSGDKSVSSDFMQLDFVNGGAGISLWSITEKGKDHFGHLSSYQSLFSACCTMK